MRRQRVQPTIVRIDVEVVRPGRRARWHEASRVLVDSGSEMTWLPAELLRAARVPLFKRGQPFVMANAIVDPRRRCLVAAGPMPVAAA